MRVCQWKYKYTIYGLIRLETLTCTCPKSLPDKAYPHGISHELMLVRIAILFFFYMYNVNWLFQSAVIRPSLTSTNTSDKAGGLRDGLSTLESDNFWNWVPDKEVIDPENNGWHWNTYHVHNHSDQSSVRKTFTISTIIARSGRIT